MARMRRPTKIILRIVLVCFCLLFFCEYLIYYLVIYQCSWPKLNKSTEKTATDELKLMLIADTHLLGKFRGHWLDKLKREWQIYRAFQTAVKIFQPEVIFVLGDLFDEGNWGGSETFQKYVDRFHDLFEVPTGIKLIVLPGNHDMGFHNYMSPYTMGRFNVAFDTELVKLITLKDNHFILINSMAMEGDRCSFCHEAEVQLSAIASDINCAKGILSKCRAKRRTLTYSRPIILQHFPMFRKSDELCNEIDEAPADIKRVPFRESWDCLSNDSSEMIYNKFSPRLIVTGHTHHGCHVVHREDIHEFTIPSFSWRNKNNPTFMLATISPFAYSTKKCSMPQETTVHLIYIAGFLISMLGWVFSSQLPLLGTVYHYFHL